jgi:hypothetical protein
MPIFCNQPHRTSVPANGAELHFNVRTACAMVVLAQTARGRPRSFAEAVGGADCPAMR